MSIKSITRWATAALFLALAWQSCFFDLPLRSFLWNESLLSGPLSLIGVEWGDWVSSQGVDASIRYIQYGFALAFLIGLTAVLWPASPGRHGLIKIAAVASAILLFLGWPDHFFQWGYLLEIAIRLGTPFIYLSLLKGRSIDRLSVVMRWLIAATFIGHGLYALGFYPRPASFVNWTSAGLGLTEDLAVQLLVIVGWIDIIAASLLLLLLTRLWRLALYWIIPWAILTTLARYWSNSAYTELSYLLYRWTPEVLARIPHILLPLALYYYLSQADSKSSCD